MTLKIQFDSGDKRTVLKTVSRVYPTALAFGLFEHNWVKLMFNVPVNNISFTAVTSMWDSFTIEINDT